MSTEYTARAREAQQHASALLAYSRGADWRDALGELYSDWKYRITTIGNLTKFSAFAHGDYVWDTIRNLRPKRLKICDDVGRAACIPSLLQRIAGFDVRDCSIGDKIKFTVGRGALEIAIVISERPKDYRFDVEMLHMQAPEFVVPDVHGLNDFYTNDSEICALIVKGVRKGIANHYHPICITAGPKSMRSEQKMKNHGFTLQGSVGHSGVCVACRGGHTIAHVVALHMENSPYFPLHRVEIVNGVAVTATLAWIMDATRNATTETVLNAAERALQRMRAMKLVTEAEINAEPEFMDCTIDKLTEYAKKYVIVDVKTLCWAENCTYGEIYARVIRELEGIADEMASIGDEVLQCGKWPRRCNTLELRWSTAL